METRDNIPVVKFHITDILLKQMRLWPRLVWLIVWYQGHGHTAAFDHLVPLVPDTCAKA